MSSDPQRVLQKMDRAAFVAVAETCEAWRGFRCIDEHKAGGCECAHCSVEARQAVLRAAAEHGWQMRPDEPTYEMRVEGLKRMIALIESYRCSDDPYDSAAEQMQLGAEARTGRETDEAYAGYLDAAPKLTEDESEQ